MTAYSPFRDFLLKLLAIAIAVILWMSVTDDPVIELGIEVPIEFENVPMAVEIIDQTVDTVRVRLRGSRDAVHAVDEASAHAYVDLIGLEPVGLEPGRYNLSVNFDSTDELRVMNIEPSFVGITVR
tara:strand:- start:16357 stop:16734 length:378 start_codon:yes stop_codon:yes gene_type:complete